MTFVLNFNSKGNKKIMSKLDPTMTLKECSPHVPIITNIENKLPKSWEQNYSMKTNLRSNKKESKQTLLFFIV